jgi:hypothetical protein
VAVQSAGQPRVEYVQHRLAGTHVSPPGAGEWSVRWTAPAETIAPVIFHVAANSANDDNSQFGDYIYIDSLTVPPRSDR